MNLVNEQVERLAVIVIKEKTISSLSWWHSVNNYFRQKLFQN